jgi:hypothetical protein
MAEIDIQRIQKALDELGEHFDAVHIFASRHESSEGKTYEWQKGVGNFNTRFGQVALWAYERSRENSKPMELE